MIVDHYNVSFSMICNGSTSSCVGIASVGFGAIYNKFTRLRSRSEPCHHFLASSGRGPFVMALHFLAQCSMHQLKLQVEVPRQKCTSQFFRPKRNQSAPGKSLQRGLGLGRCDLDPSLMSSHALLFADIMSTLHSRLTPKYICCDRLKIFRYHTSTQSLYIMLIVPSSEAVLLITELVRTPVPC